MANVLPGITLTTAETGATPAWSSPHYANDETLIGSTSVGAGVYGAGESYLIADLGIDYDLTSSEVDISSGGPGGISVETSPDGSTWTERVAASAWSALNVHTASFTVTARYVRLVFTHGGGYGGTNLVQEWRVFGTAAAGEPPPDPPDLPPYVEPEPAEALLEIYTTDPDALGGWGPTGSGAWGDPEWAASGWQDVTHLGVSCNVAWGAQDGDAGILADISAGTWEVKLYDPDRDLDPAYEGSPYYPQIVPGLPVRISHRGVILRTGVLETAAHSYADDTGVFRVTDHIATMARAKVPEDSILADFLYERARDAIGAAGLSITSFAGGGPAVGTQAEGEKSVWDHVRLGALDAGYVPFVNRYNELAFSPWAAPTFRSRTIDDTELTDLFVYIDDKDQYSRVQATEDGTTYIERAITPTPRYGKRVYRRADPVADEDAFAARILADRFSAALRYELGEIRPLTADSVESLGTLTCNEEVNLTVSGVITATTRILGGRFRVVWGRYDELGEDKPRWAFWFTTTRTTSVMLVTDQSGEPLVSDDDATSFLEAD